MERIVERINVMIAGLPGKMATLLAEAIVAQEDMRLYPYALAEEQGMKRFEPTGVVQLIPTSDHKEVLSETNIDVIADFTQPRSVNLNAELYCASGIPFVMGTTGGDRQALEEAIKNSSISAVIATNMAVPVVIFQAMIHFAAQKFQNSLKGFKLVIRESHQAQKPDPSGTAVSLLESFRALGMPFEKEQIIMVRDPFVQEVEMSIPRQYLGGHGYHTYTLLSPDGSVELQFKHNILGRSTYVDGALTAIRFLAARKKEKGKVFSMIDVLRGA